MMNTEQRLRAIEEDFIQYFNQAVYRYLDTVKGEDYGGYREINIRKWA